jgi:hypothetical protein
LWELCPFKLRNFPKYTSEAACQCNSSETKQKQYVSHQSGGRHNDNQMQANPDKFQAIAVGKKTHDENISFNFSARPIRLPLPVESLMRASL